MCVSVVQARERGGISSGNTGRQHIRRVLVRCVHVCARVCICCGLPHACTFVCCYVYLHMQALPPSPPASFRLCLSVSPTLSLPPSLPAPLSTHHVKGLLCVVPVQVVPEAGLKCGQVDVQVC